MSVEQITHDVLMKNIKRKEAKVKAGMDYASTIETEDQRRESDLRKAESALNVDPKNDRLRQRVVTTKARRKFIAGKRDCPFKRPGLNRKLWMAGFDSVK